MRRLTTRRPEAPSRGLTLIEIMVALTIGALLLTFAGPMIGDYLTNTRMREGMNGVMAQALYAQSEALKRNTPVRLTVTTSAANVSVVSTGDVIRTQPLTNGLAATAGTLDFGRNGLPTPLGSSLDVTISQTGTTCSAEARCPTLKVDGGGGMRVCANSLSCP